MDAAGNAAQTATKTLTLDKLAPSVTTVTDATTADVTKDAITFTVTFDEAVVGTLTTSSFTATNGEVTSVTKVNGANAYTVVVTPNSGVASGSVALSLVGAGLQDAAGNTVADADLSGKGSQAIDTLAPTVTLAAVADSNDDPDGSFNQGFTVTQGASVTVKIGGGAITLLDYFDKSTAGGLDTYTAKTGQFNGTEVITVDASLRDSAGNTGNATQLDLGKIDTTAPVLSIDTTLEIDNLINAEEDNSVVITGTNYSLSLARIDPVTRAVITNYADLASGNLATGTSSDDFGTIGVDWVLASGDNEDPGSNYIVVNQLQVVPEPSTYALLGMAALGLAFYVVRRRRA
jgi:hypothetical protein